MLQSCHSDLYCFRLLCKHLKDQAEYPGEVNMRSIWCSWQIIDFCPKKIGLKGPSVSERISCHFIILIWCHVKCGDMLYVYFIDFLYSHCNHPSSKHPIRHMRFVFLTFSKIIVIVISVWNQDSLKHINLSSSHIDFCLSVVVYVVRVQVH